MATSQQRVTLKYNSNKTPTHVFNDIKFFLHSTLGYSQRDKDFIESLVFKFQTIFAMDPIEKQSFEDSNATPKRKILDISSFLESRSIFDKNVIQQFLDLLLNMDEQEHFSKTIHARIAESFGDDVQIVRMVTRDPENMQESTAPLVPSQEASTSSSLTPRLRDPDTGAIKLGHTGIYYYGDQIISEGETSNVYKGYHMFTTRPAAVKWLHSKGNTLFENELKVWHSITNLTKDNINIVQLFAYTPWEDGVGLPKTYYFAMELASTDLQKRVEEFASNAPGENQHEKLKGYLHDAANGLQWLHSRKPVIIHRDIKPHNILIFTNGGENGETAKLGDFGICKSLSRASTMGTNTKGIGTLNWMSPEAIEAYWNDETFRMTPSVDVFSFGMTCSYAMSLGKHPFKIDGSSKLIHENIRNPSQLPNRCSSLVEGNHLFSWMTTKYEGQVLRPTIDQVLSHPFFYAISQSFNLIIEVAKCLDDSKCSEVKDIRNELDSCYPVFLAKDRQVHSLSFNWKHVLGDNIFKLLSQRKSSSTIKKYNENSIMSLIEAIRDKCVHYTNLKSDLVENEHIFGVKDENGNWRFSKDKYIVFFHKNFPELVTFLFMYFTQESGHIVASLKSDNNLNGFENMPIGF